MQTCQAAVTFGDPANNMNPEWGSVQAYESYCAPGDALCESGFAITAAHVSGYGPSADEVSRSKPPC